MREVVSWLVIGGANRIITAAPEQPAGGVSQEEAFLLLATERGRHVRFFASEVVRSWMAP